MFIKLLARLLFGYVRIEVEGYYIERFINICTNNKILIWNLKREKGVKLYLNIGINDFRKLSTIARKTNCKIKILRKKVVEKFAGKNKTSIFAPAIEKQTVVWKSNDSKTEWLGSSVGRANDS